MSTNLATFARYDRITILLQLLRGTNRSSKLTPPPRASLGQLQAKLGEQRPLLYLA